MACKYCTDPDGVSCFPVYGVGPHIHTSGVTKIIGKEDWPTNFKEDPDCPGLGVWWCPHCGDGAPDDLQANAN